MTYTIKNATGNNYEATSLRDAKRIARQILRTPRLVAVDTDNGLFCYGSRSEERDDANNGARCKVIIERPGDRA